MSFLRFSVLASGSSANVTFVESHSCRILIDCGLSARETERRLTAIGVNPDSIQAVFVTHEHSDHIAGIPVFTKRHRIPVFANYLTAKALRKAWGIETIETGVEFEFQDLKVLPFSVPHDASDTVGFRIDSRGLVFAQVTDIGHISATVRSALSGVRALVLESNHDLDLLYRCDYPWELKERIASSHGHLSNHDSSALILELLATGLEHAILAHLSLHSNSPEIALKTAMLYLSPYLQNQRLKTLLCAARTEVSPWIEIGSQEKGTLASSNKKG